VILCCASPKRIIFGCFVLRLGVPGPVRAPVSPPVRGSVTVLTAVSFFFALSRCFVARKSCDRYAGLRDLRALWHPLYLPPITTLTLFYTDEVFSRIIGSFDQRIILRWQEGKSFTSRDCYFGPSSPDVSMGGSLQTPGTCPGFLSAMALPFVSRGKDQFLFLGTLFQAFFLQNAGTDKLCRSAKLKCFRWPPNPLAVSFSEGPSFAGQCLSSWVDFPPCSSSALSAFFHTGLLFPRKTASFFFPPLRDFANPYFI